MRSTIGLALLFASAVPTSGLALATDCQNQLLPSHEPKGPTRTVEAEDLVGLRDIGPTGDMLFGRSPLSVSPDGHRVAFEMHRGDATTNSYCVGLVVVDLDRRHQAHMVNVGGDFVPDSPMFRGVARRPLGAWGLITPRWSPDGTSIAFLRRDHAVTQLWRVRSDGSDARQLTQDNVDVLGFCWSGDGRHILYSDQPGMIAAQAALDRQGRTGYPFGPNFEPMISNRPFVMGPLGLVLHSLDLATGDTKLASPEERAEPNAKQALQGEISAQVEAGLPDGRRAWTTPRDPTRPFAGMALHAELPGGQSALCHADLCDGIVDVHWLRDGHTLFYVRREGWANSRYGAYIWEPGAWRQPRRTYLTDGWIGGCVAAERRVLCLKEDATVPRHIVSIDPFAGRGAPVFDPNPDFETLRLGSVRRLTWTTRIGSQAFGDLVLPPGYGPGSRLPLIVVQYQSRGFLRGGTGDEYPIQLFAAHGYAVLSVNRPTPLGMQTAHTDEELGHIGLHDWADRRNVMASIDAGVDAAERLGVVDPHKIGITGLSDGGTSVDFAMVNSHRYSVAETSSCCTADSSFLAYLNEQASDHFRQEGYPGIAEDGRDYWKPISLLLNARAIDVPILMQLSDEEYLDAVQAYTGLRELEKPVDMIVYPDEHHLKWQPCHRDAVYRRAVAWFDFWWKGNEDPDPVDPDDYLRWRHLRLKREKAPASGPVRARIESRLRSPTTS